MKKNKTVLSYEQKAIRINRIVNRIKELDMLISCLRAIKHFEFKPYTSVLINRDYPVFGYKRNYLSYSVRIEPPFSTKEQEIISEFKNKLIKSYILERRRLKYRLNKL